MRLERVGNSLRRIDPMFAHGTLDTLAYRTAARRGFKGNSLHSLGIFCANAEPHHRVPCRGFPA